MTNKTCIGIVAFGNLPFTQLTVNSIIETTRNPFDIFLVVGKPGDEQTKWWAKTIGLQHVVHSVNYGFPYSLNDIYDFAFVQNDYANLICVGNDVVPYPGGVDSLIEVSNATDWEWCCSSQYDVASLCNQYPEARQHFSVPAFKFDKWNVESICDVNFYTPSVKPWELHAHTVPPFSVDNLQVDCIKDVRNLCLFKRSVFEKIGYADANFWPGGYFEDNDYCTRARKAGIKACGVPCSAYFHFWSRTIHQESGGSTSTYFGRNGMYYSIKWGGGFDQERWHVPFNGTPHKLCDHVALPADLCISSRKDDAAITDYWRKKQQ